MRDVHPGEPLPADYKDLRPARAKPLPANLAALVLVPLCSIGLTDYLPDIADPLRYRSQGKALAALAWSALLQAGFKLYVCFIRGDHGSEELVVVLPEGSVSWPVRQLTPETVDFLEVQAL